MQYFDLIFNECKKLNELLTDKFINNELFFIDANISEVSYGLNKNLVIFCYYPERYEYGKIMNLKGVNIRIDYDKERQYSVSELNSFFKNHFKFYDNSNVFTTTEEHLDSIGTLINNINSNQENWEQKFILYKKSITPKW